MSGKRRANVMTEYVYDSSSEEDRNDARDDDFEVSSSGRSAPGRQESIASNGSSETRRRDRGISKRPCLNRNAVMARENRQRKKEYLEKVESKLSFYRQENKNLSNVIQRQDIDIKRLRAEVSYLKNVLNNSSSINTLLKSMNDALSVKKSNPCVVKKIQNSSDNIDKFDKSSQKSWNSESLWRRGGKYIDRSLTRKGPYEIPLAAKKAHSLADSDHTYTTLRDGSLDEKMQYYGDSDDNSPYGKDDGAFSKITVEASTKDRSTGSLLGISDNELDELPQFDANLFETLSNNCNDIADSMDYFRNASDAFDTPGNLFESLENSGICLHVNSSKVSLEFCSICHLNSINTSE